MKSNYIRGFKRREKRKKQKGMAAVEKAKEGQTERTKLIDGGL